MTLAEQNRDFAGVGVFADVVEQLTEQAIQGKDQRFAFRRRGKPVVKTAADPAFSKGELVDKVVQSLTGDSSSSTVGGAGATAGAWSGEYAARGR